MKQKDLIKLLERNGFRFERHGGCHEVYKRGNETEMIPRHRDINEQLAKGIIRKWNLK